MKCDIFQTFWNADKLTCEYIPKKKAQYNVIRYNAQCNTL